MQETKIQFSPDEIRLMTDGSWILTKNAVIAKIYGGMAQLSERMKILVQAPASGLPVEFATSNAKISRGENYRGLPYVMMDYPKVFGKEDILAIRTFFWWGQYCSITLHAKGKYAASLLQKLPAAIAKQPHHQFHIATTGDEWNHDLGSEDYGLLNETGGEALQNGNYLKLAAKVELEQWERMEVLLYEKFEVLINTLKESPDGSDAPRL